jgi:hypothetical protein
MVKQLWRDDVQIDARERQFASEKTRGNLTIEAHEGERFATLQLLFARLGS